MAIGLSGNSSTVTLMLSPGMHISTPSGQLDFAGHVRRAEVELRPIAGEERRMPAAFLLGQHVHARLELGVRRDRSRAWPAPARAPDRPFQFRAAAPRRCRRPRRNSSVLLNISTPVTTVLRGAFIRPTISTSSPTLTLPLLDTAGADRSTAFDRENVLNAHQERLILRPLGRWGCTMSRASNSLSIHSQALSSLPTDCMAAKALPRIIGTFSPGKLILAEQLTQL